MKNKYFDEMYELHIEAGFTIEDALAAKAERSLKEARKKFARAFNYELKALEYFQKKLNPSDYSQLYKSIVITTSSLAVECEKPSFVQPIVDEAMTMNLSDAIRSDLTDFLQRLKETHGLQVRSFQFEDQEIDIDLHSGQDALMKRHFVPYDVMQEKINALTDLFVIIRESLARELRIPLELARRCLHAGFLPATECCHRLRFQIVVPGQNALLKNCSPARITGQFHACLEAFNKKNYENLPQYLRSTRKKKKLLTIAYKIAPDGKAIQHINYSFNGSVFESRPIEFTRTQQDIQSELSGEPGGIRAIESHPIDLEGYIASVHYVEKTFLFRQMLNSNKGAKTIHFLDNDLPFVTSNYKLELIKLTVIESDRNYFQLVRDNVTCSDNL